MRFDLATLIRRARNPRRKSIVLREIIPTQAFATDLFLIYKRVILAISARLPRITAEYERTLAMRDGIVTDSVFDLESLFDELQAELTRLFVELTPQLRDWAVRAERWHRGKWRGAALTASGVDLETLIGPEDVRETLQTVIARNVALVRDVSAQAQAKMQDSVFRGLQERRPARDVAKELDEAVSFGRKRALRIASDQNTKLASELDGERMRQAGIGRFKWRSSHKLHPRKWHAERDQKLYELDSREAVSAGDNGEKEVIDADDMPGRPVACGCRKQAVVVFD